MPGQEGFWAAVRRLSRGDVGFMLQRLDRQIGRAEDAVEPGTRGARDIAVIAGVSLTMLGVKALKVLPSIPFAPGHKLVLLTPLYVVASRHTRRRTGATLTGLTMGTTAFLMGDGKYGIFEILKHVAPGVICDLVVPLVGHTRRPWVWAAVGGVIALGRFATIFLITLAVQAPAIAYAILLPGLTVHVVFGAASGWVTAHLVEALRAHEPHGEAVQKAETNQGESGA